MGFYHRVRRFLPLRIKYPVVLMYHRVASPAIDPWELSVSMENFEQQMQVLKETGLVVPVRALIEQTFQQRRQEPCVAITFDDGYTDNYLAAKPILEKYALPATFFISTAYTDTREPFWWDELDALLLLKEKLPERISIHIGKEPFTFHLGEDAVLSAEQQRKQKQWMYEQPPPTKRCELYLAIWERLIRLSSAEINASMESIRRWAGAYPAPDPGSLPMTSAQVGGMAGIPLFEIGMHTATHCDLRYRSAEEQCREITMCSETLNQKYNLDVRTLAYPFGKCNADTLSVARDLKLSAAFTTKGNVLTPQTDRYQAGRFQVKNWNGKQFKKQLFRWLKNN